MKDFFTWLERRRHMLLFEKKFRAEQEALSRRESRQKKNYIESFDPEMRKKKAELAKRYYQRKLAEDPSFKDKLKEYRNAYYQKIKNDPEFKRKNRERTAKYYREKLKDRYKNDKEYRKTIQEAHRKRHWMKKMQGK